MTTRSKPSRATATQQSRTGQKAAPAVPVGREVVVGSAAVVMISSYVKTHPRVVPVPSTLAVTVATGQRAIPFSGSQTEPQAFARRTFGP